MPRRRREISINAQISTDNDIIWLKLVKASTSLILVGASIISNNLNYSLAVVSILISEVLSISRSWKPFYHTGCLSDSEWVDETRNLIQNDNSTQSFIQNGNSVQNSGQNHNLAENPLSESVQITPRNVNPSTNSSQTRNTPQNNLQTHPSNIPKFSIKSLFKQTIKNTSVSTLIRILLYTFYLAIWLTANDQNGMFFITLAIILLCLYFIHGPTSMNNFYQGGHANAHRNTSQESSCQVLTLTLLFLTHLTQYLWWNLELNHKEQIVGLEVVNIMCCQVLVLGLGFYCLQEGIELVCLLRKVGVDRVRDDEPLLDSGESGEILLGGQNSENVNQEFKKLVDPEECFHS